MKKALQITKKTGVDTAEYQVEKRWIRGGFPQGLLL